MKRKADTKIDEDENAPLFKSLRKSVSDFIRENESSALTSTNKEHTAQDPDDGKWKQYRLRLATFPALVKLSGPKEISPSVCASHGWQYHDKNFLQCSECQRVLCVSLPETPAISMRLMRSCIRNIQRKLNESHDLNCRWRTNSGLNLLMPYNIYHRYGLLQSAALCSVPLAADVIEAHLLSGLADLTDHFLLVLAISGWLPAQNRADRLDCLLCGRELCLTVFSEEKPLNPLEQHYSYCPVSDKEFPLWREAVTAAVPSVKKEKEPLITQLSRVKSMLNYIFRK